jgi:hypothetical protein
MSKQKPFYTIAAHTSACVILDEKLLDNRVIYKGTHMIDTRLHIWDPLSDGEGNKVIGLPSAENYSQNVQDFIIVSDDEDLNHFNNYLVISHTYNNLKIWDVGTKNEIATLENNGGYVNHLTQISHGKFAYTARRNNGEWIFSSWQVKHQQHKKIDDITADISPMATITWLSDQYFLGFSLYEFSLWTKDRHLDGHKVKGGIIDIQPVPNSNYLMVSTYGAIQLWKMKEYQQLVFVNSVSIPANALQGMGYSLTILPNGDAVAAIGVLAADSSFRCPSYNYSLHFYRFPELKFCRDGLGYKLARIHLDFSKLFPPELCTAIISNLPDYKFYQAYKSAGLFKNHKPSANVLGEIKVPGPVLQ